MNTNDLARICETHNKNKMLCDSHSKKLFNQPLHSQGRILAFWQGLSDKESCIFIDQVGFTKPYSKPPEVTWKKCKSWSFQLKSREQGITARGTECAAALLGMPLRDLSKTVFINVKMQLSMDILILKIKNLKLGFILQYCILKCIFIYCPNFNST